MKKVSVEKNGAGLLELMSREHREMLEILEQISAMGTDQAKTRLERYTLFKARFSRYSATIQNVLYAILENIFESQEEVLEAYGRHQVIKQRLRLLDQLDPKSDDWATAFGELRECFSLHLTDEEATLYEKLKIIFDGAALGVLGTRFTEGLAKLTRV